VDGMKSIDDIFRYRVRIDCPEGYNDQYQWAEHNIVEEDFDPENVSRDASWIVNTFGGTTVVEFRFKQSEDATFFALKWL
jgi:hypothetical protein